MNNQNNAVVDNPFFRQSFEYRTIYMVAPASSAPAEDIQRLCKLDLKIHIPEAMIAAGTVYHSNTDQKRLSFLQEALFNSDTQKIVWALRGGYGSARLIEDLGLLEKPKHQVMFIGCSDMTALHLFFAQAWGWKTIHGPGLRALLRPEQDPDHFLKIAAIVAGAKESSIADLQAMNPEAASIKQVRGFLTGGNLTLVQTSLGTPWQVQSQDKILFLEDVAEPGYKIDRALTHLRQAGVFKGVRAVVLGDFEESDPKKPEVLFALERFAKEIDLPVFKSHSFGHGTKNYPLVYHSEASISPAATGASFELWMRF